MNKTTAQRISHLIKEVLSKPPLKDKCNCGCHSCENVGNKGPVLNENLSTKVTLSENMQYHVNNKLPITENTFRYGSEAFLNLWTEARHLYSRNAIHVNDIDKEIISETDLGEYGIYEGKKVPLDLLMEEDNELGGKEDVEFATNVLVLPYIELLSAIENDYSKGDIYYEVEQAIFDKNLNQIPSILRKYELDKEYSHLTRVNEAKYQTIKEDIALYSKVYESVNIDNSYKIDNFESDDVSVSFIFTDKHDVKRKLQYFKGDSVKLLWLNPSTQEWTTEKIPSKYEDDKVMNTFGKILIKIILPKYNTFHFKALNSARYRLFRALIYNSLDTSKYDMNFDDDKMEIEVTLKSSINEAEKKKQPALGKPKRGGSKKFYVYVRDPKSKRIKKVSFGMAGGRLRAKLNNPKARQAFAKRHDCANKKDKTKASYWSCRLPKFSKALGFNTTFSGYW